MYAFVAVALLSAVMAFAGAWNVQKWRFGYMEKERIEAAQEKAKFDRRAVDVAAVGHEKDKVQIRTEFITITERVEHVISQPYYASDAPACFDADGLRELAAAAGAAPVASQPPAALPEPRPTH